MEIPEKFVQKNEKEIFSDICSKNQLHDKLAQYKINMSCEEFLEYCLKEDRKDLSKSEKEFVMGFLEVLDAEEERDEQNFLRRTGEYKDNAWFPNLGNSSKENLAKSRDSLEESKEDSEAEVLEFNLKCSCSSPASVDIFHEECPQMKEYRNLFGDDIIPSSEYSYGEEISVNDEVIDPFDIAKCLQLPPKYNRLSMPIQNLKMVPCVDLENENDPVDFVNTFQFQEWKDEDEESILPQIKPDRIKRSDSKAMIARQMMGYVRDLETNHRVHRVPDVFQRFWLDTSTALGLESSAVDASFEREESISIINIQNPDDDGGNHTTITTATDPLDIVSVFRQRDEVHEDFDYSAWDAETSSNDMSLFPLNQIDPDPQLEDPSFDANDEDYRNFFMGTTNLRECPGNRSHNCIATQTELDGGRIPELGFDNPSDDPETWDWDLLTRIRGTSFTEPGPDLNTIDSAQNFPANNPLNEDERPVSFISHVTHVGEGEIRNAYGLPQNIVNSIEEYIEEEDSDEESEFSTGEDIENEEQLEEQFEFDFGVNDLSEYFNEIRVLRMPDGQIPPSIEVDEDFIQTGTITQVVRNDETEE